MWTTNSKIKGRLQSFRIFRDENTHTHTKPNTNQIAKGGRLVGGAMERGENCQKSIKESESRNQSRGGEESLRGSNRDEE